MLVALLIFLLLSSGCASTAGLLSSRPLTPQLDIQTSPAFEKALRAGNDTHKLEAARIEYLLERIRLSPYNFIRNGSRHNGTRAWLHLKWKHFRIRKQVKTAEDFIQKVASGSKASGNPYMIEFEDRKQVPLKTIFLNELRSFDQAVKDTVQSETPTTKTT